MCAKAHRLEFNMTGFYDMGFGGGFGFPNFLFSLIPMVVFLGFIFVFGMIIYSTVQKAKVENKNNKSPILSVEAKVVAKRTEVTHHNHNNINNNTMRHSSSTSYYVTFQVESGDRMEFLVSGNEYGMLVEQDMGKVTFQGTRYLGFTRT
jgi:ABC-type transport system involved in multi-copper enzyme maturation permease subunit